MLFICAGDMFYLWLVKGVKSSNMCHVSVLCCLKIMCTVQAS